MTLASTVGWVPPPPLHLFSQEQLVRGEHDSGRTCYSGRKVVTLGSSQDSWGGGKGLVSCPYSGSQNPVGTEEETVRYGCWGAWDGPWGPVLFHKSEKPSPGTKGPSSLFPGQPGTKQPFLCSAVWTERDRFDVPGPRWLVIPQPQCKNWPCFLPAEEATAGHPPFVCSGRGNC